MAVVEEMLCTALADTVNGWSMGTFGAIAEFRRDPHEPTDCIRKAGGWRQYVTARGGIGVWTDQDVTPVAYETLSSDGHTWGHTLAFCLPLPREPSAGAVLCRGADPNPLQPSMGSGVLFDLGVGRGHVSLSVRTADPALIEALQEMEGKPLLGEDGARARALLVEMSPARIACSPLGRIEVYAAIPPPGGRSPSGPHTHLLPKLLATGRPFSANAPIPAELQPVLTLHPPSPWRNAMGTRIPFDAYADEHFRILLERFGLPEDKLTRLATEAAVTAGADPAAHLWPSTRRARAQARITLRRLAQQLGAARVAPWMALYDRGGSTDDAEADPAD